MLLNRFALSLAPLAVLAACGGEPDGRAAGSASRKFEPAAEVKARDDALAERETSQLEWLKQTLDVPAHADVYKAALDQARGRAVHCPNAQCFERALNRRETRLDFADGKSAPIPYLPFPSGRFVRGEAGYTGPVRIVPLIDGRAMLVVSLSFKGRPSCTLDGVMTRDEDEDTWTVASLEEGLPTLVLKPVGNNGFDLSYDGPAHAPHDDDYCTAGTGIDGHYTLDDRTAA